MLYEVITPDVVRVLRDDGTLDPQNDPDLSNDEVLALYRAMVRARPSDRLHRFVLDGMRDNALACEDAGVRYHAYVAPEPGAGRGLLEVEADHALATEQNVGEGRVLVQERRNNFV